MLAWTTTPWTLISNAALAIGVEITYARVRPAGSDEVLVMAKDLVETVLGEGAEILDEIAGGELVGIAYEPPFDYVTDFGPKSHTVLPADFVTTTDGTGVVHTALAFGEDDFRLGEEQGMTLQNPVLPDGTFDQRAGEFAGRHVKEADADIIEALRSSGRLLRAETYEHAYPHCWRCGTPLLYYAKSSWYLRTTGVRDRMLAENAAIGWHPEHIRDGRFGKWLEGNVDWALSRERYWGTPLPIWECSGADCDARLCVGSREDLTAFGGEVPSDLHRPLIDDVVLDCEACGSEMHRVSDVIDTWYDSGAMPFAQFHYPFENKELFASRFPADFVCEGIDQTRGWFYSLLAESVMLFDQTSYRNCVCLGLILDPEGQKMSKSRGNVVEPREVIDTHGADAFRWYYLTAQQPWAGYRFSAETVGESVRQFLLTVWNTYSFWVLYANAEGVDPTAPPGPPPAGEGSELDRWILSRLQGAVAEVTAKMDEFDCTDAGRVITTFADELSNWYVRLSRRRFWDGDPAAIGTLRHCLVELAKLLAPFTPFLADEIHSNLTGEDSVHLADYPEPDPDRRDQALEAGVEAALRAIELGRAARAASKIKIRQPLAKAVVVATEQERSAIEAIAEIVTAELNVKELEFVSDQSELASYAVKPNFRSLGPRFGKDMPQVAAAIAALDPGSVANAIKGESRVGISIEGNSHDLEPDDLSLVMEPLAGYEVEAEAGQAVALATELTAELVAEGQAREVVRAVQNARKEAGLDVTDRITLALGGEESLIAAARANEPYVAGETLAAAISYDAESGATAQVDGRELLISIERT